MSGPVNVSFGTPFGREVSLDRVSMGAKAFISDDKITIHHKDHATGNIIRTIIDASRLEHDQVIKAALAEAGYEVRRIDVEELGSTRNDIRLLGASNIAMRSRIEELEDALDSMSKIIAEVRR